MPEFVPTIRAYEQADAPALVDIWWRASLAAHPFLGEARLFEERTLVEEVYLPKAETFVAVPEHAPVGFIGLLGGFIGGLFVDPAYGRRGIGRALVARALARTPDLTLEVYSANEAAVAFYTAIGAAEIGRRPTDDKGAPFELILMRIVRRG